MKTNSKSSNNATILVKINGLDKSIPQNVSILELLDIYKINKDRVVIELNKKIITKDKYECTALKKTDEIEIVTFVGGG